MYFEIALSVVVLILVLVFGYLRFVVWLLINIFESIQPLEPTNVISISSGTTDPNPLFRHITSLRSKLAWVELGTFPTPLHRAQLQKDDKTIQFWMKREDLCSPKYGGNKVRTLQYQLAALKIHQDQNPSAKLYVLGSPGSNQVIATIAHGTTQGLNFHVTYPSPDAPDIDNTLNVLSTLSFGPLSVATWDIPSVCRQVLSFISIVRSKDDKIFCLGGNSLGGILGQMGGALELAEQISAGEIPDIDEIYLPMGSSCTTAGLILGVCLARHLKMNAFKSHRFRIVSTMIHGQLAALNRKTNFTRNWIGKYIFASPRFGIERVSAYLKELTGIDLEPSGLKFLEQEWVVIDDAEYAGDYGAHSVKSAEASAFDVKIEMTGKCPPWIKKPPAPWMCGHFTGKSFAAMLNRLESLESDDKLEVLLWQTKSVIQPRGKENEWPEFQRLAQNSKVVKKWADEGKAASVLRPGKVDVDNGTADDYRHIMTSV